MLAVGSQLTLAGRDDRDGGIPGKGIEPAAVTVLTPPGSSQEWIDELPDEFADVTAETHDPADKARLAYLASTKAGRRVWHS